MKDTVSAKTLIPSARNQLFPAAFLRFSSLPASYYFHSITHTTTSTSEASGILSTSVSVVVLRPGLPPVVRIKCLTGCSRPHAKTHPIWLEGECANCPVNTEQLSYAWSFTYAQQSNADLRGFDWATDSTTGNGRSYVVVNPDKFMKSLAQDEFSFTLRGNAAWKEFDSNWFFKISVLEFFFRLTDNAENSWKMIIKNNYSRICGQFEFEC